MTNLTTKQKKASVTYIKTENRKPTKTGYFLLSLVKLTKKIGLERLSIYLYMLIKYLFSTRLPDTYERRNI